MLELPVHQRVRFVLVTPHYPENVGAACRAMKTMGFTRLGLVHPSKLAQPDHPMARKMAVKSEDVLDGAELYENLDEAVVGSDVVIATSARRGISGILTPVQLAEKVLDWVEERRKIVVLFGNEKSGLTAEEVDRADFSVRVPLAAAQPSLNLSQAVQIIAYEFFHRAVLRAEKQK